MQSLVYYIVAAIFKLPDWFMYIQYLVVILRNVIVTDVSILQNHNFQKCLKYSHDVKVLIASLYM